MPPDCKVFIEGLHNFLKASQRLLFGLPLHKFVTTKTWRDLSANQKRVYDIAMEHVREKVCRSRAIAFRPMQRSIYPSLYSIKFKFCQCYEDRHILAWQHKYGFLFSLVILDDYYG